MNTQLLANGSVRLQFEEFKSAFTVGDVVKLKTLLSSNRFVMNGADKTSSTQKEWLDILIARNEIEKKGIYTLRLIFDSVEISESDSAARVIGYYTLQTGFTGNCEVELVEARLSFTQNWEKIEEKWYLMDINNTEVSASLLDPNKPMYSTLVPRESNC